MVLFVVGFCSPSIQVRAADDSAAGQLDAQFPASSPDNLKTANGPSLILGGNVPQAQKYKYQDPLQGVSVSQLVARILSNIFPLVGALFFVMFVWGGAQWFTAAGDEGKIKKGRQTLINAAVGITIIMGAYIIVTTIVTQLSGALGK